MQDYFVLARQISNVIVMLNNTGKLHHLKYTALFAFYQSRYALLPCGLILFHCSSSPTI